IVCLGQVPTLRKAAECCGSNIVYVAATLVIRAVKDPTLEAAILTGKVRLLNAAEAMKPLAALMTSAAFADAGTKLAIARAVSPEVMWDDSIMPALNSESGTGVIDRCCHAQKC